MDLKLGVSHKVNMSGCRQGHETGVGNRVDGNGCESLSTGA